MSEDRPTDNAAVPETGDDSATPSAAATPEATETAKPAGRRRLTTLLIIAVVLFGLDLLTKCLAVAFIDPGESVPIIGDFARFTLVRNPGAAFSMATGMTFCGGGAKNVKCPGTRKPPPTQVRGGFHCRADRI
ncbi:signal peptidase II [Nocardia salmonicida]|uniref:signal peptidase II n=1 Tax=Nocardia salmonicida TaxID=53431 RepID=UPI00365DF7C3